MGRTPFASRRRHAKLVTTPHNGPITTPTMGSAVPRTTGVFTTSHNEAGKDP